MKKHIQERIKGVTWKQIAGDQFVDTDTYHHAHIDIQFPNPVHSHSKSKWISQLLNILKSLIWSQQWSKLQVQTAKKSLGSTYVR